MYKRRGKLDDVTNIDIRAQGNLSSGNAGAAERMPVTAIICGRGRVGKTVVANALVQFCRERGANLQVWNADRQNETHSLSVFHPDAERPPTDDSEEKRVWLETKLGQQVRERFDAVLDMAGGDPTIKRLAKDVRLVTTMERQGIRPVALHILGPEKADLDDLKQSMEDGLFMPTATLIVCNGGLVESGRSVRAMFAEVAKHEVVFRAMDKGAKLIWFPALLCMSQVTDRGLTFSEAMRGQVKPGQEPLSFFDQTRVAIFWEELLPAAFEDVPNDWLPSMTGWRR
jgi:hypothetical protein